MMLLVLVSVLYGLLSAKRLTEMTVRNNFWDWQSLSPNSGPNSAFYQFCDALEVKDGVSAESHGWGLDHALNAWGTYWNTTYYKRRELPIMNLTLWILTRFF